MLATHHGIDLDGFALRHRPAEARGDPVSLATLAAVLGASHSALLRRLRPRQKTGLVSGVGAVAGYRVAAGRLALVAGGGRERRRSLDPRGPQSVPLTAPMGPTALREAGVA